MLGFAANTSQYDRQGALHKRLRPTDSSLSPMTLDTFASKSVTRRLERHRLREK